MNYFTKDYMIVTNLEGVPFNVTIKHDDHSRWICYAYKESIGRKGYQFIMIDNHLESYTVYWEGPGNNTINNRDNLNVQVSLNDSYTNKNMEQPPSYVIVCKHKNYDLKPLPDFAIDVLHTIQTPILYEVLRRITEAFHKKHEMTPTKPYNSHVLYRPCNLTFGDSY